MTNPIRFESENAVEIIDNGKSIAWAGPHPRIPDAFLAVAPPRDWRDSGMKRFKTLRGAVAFMDKRLAERAAALA